MSGRPPARRRRGAGQRRRRRQRGFVLLELIVAAAIAALLAAWAAQAAARQLRELQAQSLAIVMDTARKAAGAFLQRHGAAIAQADTPAALLAAGYADWQAPAWPELQAAGFLPPGWTAAGPGGQDLALRILRDGACPGGPDCRVTGLVHTRQPLALPAGQAPDESFIAQWLLAAQGRGLVVWPHAAQRIVGQGRQLSNTPAWPAGTVAMLADDGLPGGGAGTLPDLSRYLMVGDARDPDLQGDATVAGSIHSGAGLHARDYVLIGRPAFESDACTAEGALSTEADFVGTLLCRGGRWRSAGRALGGAFLYNSVRGCVDSTGAARVNPETGACSCPHGYGAAMVSDVGRTGTPEGRTTGFVCLPAR